MFVETIQIWKSRLMSNNTQYLDKKGNFDKRYIDIFLVLKIFR